ncbi:hypothetical protein BCV69DRAFT_25673 [Microstroma glucosiphilum]|uniref:Uncharacterized protein n=1 Tax=Pseudomicrostroma glucosiphilum TaxID=1684307 RepID=A0A316UG54_9BASI|nr:hypothetical protein BCV69DRAFT_25673 [Pseudomicrostroma glucosiphilum]PWN24307.1 hypothetical protein BCV69DRAFT_25673 [Pseudomicrostroma glucosiphilum]
METVSPERQTNAVTSISTTMTRSSRLPLHPVPASASRLRLRLQQGRQRDQESAIKLAHLSERGTAVAVALQAGPGAAVAVAEELLPLATLDRASRLEAVDQAAVVAVVVAAMVRVVLLVREAPLSACSCLCPVQQQPKGGGGWPFDRTR